MVVCVAESVSAVHYERLFLYCLAWSVGGLLPQEERPAFDAQLRTLSSSLPPEARFSLGRTLICVGLRACSELQQ